MLRVLGWPGKKHPSDGAACNVDDTGRAFTDHAIGGVLQLQTHKHPTTQAVQC